MSPYFGDYLTDVKFRVALVGDSQVVFGARQIVEASQRFPGTPGDTVCADFVSCVPGLGFRDLPKLLTRLEDLQVRGGSHDAYVVNLGANDIGQEAAQWAAYFAGTYPSSGGLPFHQRVGAVIDTIGDDVPIYFIGVPEGLPAVPFHPWICTAVNLALARFDPTFTALLQSLSLPTEPLDQVRLLVPDPLIGAAAPKFLDVPGAPQVHYSPAAQAALWRGVFDRVIADSA